MQVLKARYDGKVFIPLESIKSKNIKDVLIVVESGKKDSEKVIPLWNLPEEERLKIVYKDFKEKFPNIEPNARLLKLVGILPPKTDEEIKRKYYGYLKEKHGL